MLNADDRGDARLSGHQPSPNSGIFIRRPKVAVGRSGKWPGSAPSAIKRLGFACVAEQKTQVNSLRQ